MRDNKINKSKWQKAGNRNQLQWMESILYIVSLNIFQVFMMWPTLTSHDPTTISPGFHLSQLNLCSTILNVTDVLNELSIEPHGFMSGKTTATNYLVFQKFILDAFVQIVK